MFRLRAATLAGRAGYTLGCAAAALILVLSGFSYFVKAQVGSIGGSDVLSGGPQTGAMNILLMGLESRTDYNGNVLPDGLLHAMHAGSVQGVEYQGVGGQATNTMILIHIFAGGQRAVGFSIPRDDWVTYPQAYDGQTQGKIDQAYGDAWQQSLNETANSSMSHDQRYLRANEAGQAATIATIESLTGVKIDHFAEVNLAGFYALAQSFGGIEACLKPWNGGQNLRDRNSGFRQKSPGYHLLDAAQSLAFVRERDNLPNGDLDRTHRQQAVLDYVIWKLENEGILNSFGQLTSLLNMAKRYIITDQGWNLLDFASQMRALTGKNMTFSTAPVAKSDGHVGNQTVNIIDATTVRQAVQNAFYPSASSSLSLGKGEGTAPLSPAATTVDVFNGGAMAGLGGQMSQALTSAGFRAGRVAETNAQSATHVMFGAGAGRSADTIAGYFTGVTATPSSSVPPGHVEILLAPDATSVPESLTLAASRQTGSAATPALGESAAGGAPAPSTGDNGQAGKAVTVQPNARFGIPCVY